MGVSQARRASSSAETVSPWGESSTTRGGQGHAGKAAAPHLAVIRRGGKGTAVPEPAGKLFRPGPGLLLQGLGLRPQHGQGGNRSGRIGPVPVGPERSLQRGQRQLVDADHPGELVPLHPLDIRPAADGNARLGTAQKLVPREADHVGPGPDALLHRGALRDPQDRVIIEGAASQIVEHRDALLPPQGHQIPDGSLLCEADELEVAGVGFQ